MYVMFILLPALATFLGLFTALVNTRFQEIKPLHEFDDFELLQHVAREHETSEYVLFQRAFVADGRPYGPFHVDIAFNNYLKTARAPSFVRSYALTFVDSELAA